MKKHVHNYLVGDIFQTKINHFILKTKTFRAYILHNIDILALLKLY